MKKLFPSAQSGQALILIALAAVGLFGIAALAIDGSIKFSDRRQAQNAADTAALAGALAKLEGDPDWELVALNRADDNGYDDNLVTNNVEAYSPPISGYYAGNASYVQVIITSHVDTYFARVLGINQTKNTVEAVALSRAGGSLFNGASVVSMNPHPNCGNGSFNVGGNGTINIDGGGFMVNSSESCGYSQTSCSVTLNITGGAGISSAGSEIDQSCGIAAPENETATQIVVPDEVYMPEEPIECSQTAATPTQVGPDDWVIYPGYYTDFPQAGLIGNNQNIILSSGVYCVDGGIHWSGATFDSLDGTSGVTLYIKSGHDFSMSINSPIHLNASSSGDYAGYLIILDGNMGSIENCTINGGSYLNVNGTIFAPYCSLRINGDNGTDSEFNAQLIGWDVTLSGNNTINIHYDPTVNAENHPKIGLMR
jgi:hypothetical protein